MIKKINKKNKSLSEYVHDFLVEIRKPTYMTPFKTPVDPGEIPHYYAVIKNPMDLSTMFQKLVDGKYGFLSEVKADFQLIIENCEAFNPQGTWIRPLCDKFKGNLEKSWAKLMETLERKSIDANKKMEKLSDFEENKNESQNLMLAENLGLRTRNQISIIKDSLNESIHSMEPSNPTIINIYFNNVNNNLNNNNINIAALEESLKESLIINEKPRPNFPEKTLILPERGSFSQESLKIDLKIEDKISNPITNISPLSPKETILETKETIMEEEVPNDLIINLDIEEIKREFRNYSEHKLRKYKKNILKSFAKLHFIFASLETLKEKDQNLDFGSDLQQLLKEIEIIKFSKSTDYNTLSLYLMNAMVWFRKTSNKIKEAKTNKRILTYFSGILKALKRIDTLSKRIKSMGIVISEEIFIAQDYGLAYFKEKLHKIQEIMFPHFNINNSIKITLPKPPKEKPENELFGNKIQKKISSEKPMFSSPSTKIVLNKDMNKVKSFSLEKPMVENKTDKLFAWAASLNSKIHEKIEGYFHMRLSQQALNLKDLNKNVLPEKIQEEKVGIPQEINRKRMFSEEIPMFEERKSQVEINFIPNKKQLEKSNVFPEEDLEFSDQDLPTEIISFQSNVLIPQSRKIEKFNEIHIDKKFRLKNPFTNENMNVDDESVASPRISVEEINIYSLFKEIEEKERIHLDEITKNLKKSNNEKLRYMKYERIVDKSSKSFVEISQEVTLDKIMIITMKVRNCADFQLEIENFLNASSFELFVDLRRIQKINELNLVENSNWLNYEILSNKLMKHKLFDALLNQLIKVTKFQVEREGGIYYCFERIPNENNRCLLSIWTAVERLTDLKLKVDGFSIF